MDFGDYIGFRFLEAFIAAAIFVPIAMAHIRWAKRLWKKIVDWHYGDVRRSD